MNISLIKKKHMNNCKDKEICILGMSNILSSSQRFVNEWKKEKIVFRIIRDDVIERANSVIQWECNILECFKEK